MATIDDAQAAAWKLANSDVPYNPDAAFEKAWLALKAAGSLPGVPIGPEMKLDDGRVAQAFTSGLLMVWPGANGGVDLL